MYFSLIVFPACFDKWDYIESFINNNLIVIDKKKIILKEQDKFDLIKLLYDGEDWIGNTSNNFEGIYYKMNACFPNEYNMINIFYVISDIDRIKKIKNEIRNYCNCGNHSIHSTDNEEEALKVKLKYF